MPHFKSLTLTAFRNYELASLDKLGNNFIVLTGANGSGKTNILEALSLFAPGRGLRKSALDVMQNNELSQPSWAVSTRIASDYGEIPMGVGYDQSSGRRITRIKGKDVRAQSELSEYMSLLWLTPQMDGLFLDSGSERRRFFDRMIFTSFDGAHAGRLTRYENAMRQRNKLLQDDEFNDTWIDSLELDMAETGVAIAASRLDFIYRLNGASRKFAETGLLKSFPMGEFTAFGYLENKLAERHSAVSCEEQFLTLLRDSRRIDAKRGGTSDGPHKTDFKVQHLKKNMAASQCSTGEQKALLTGIVLAYAQMVREEKNIMPVLLLDEIAAHYDKDRRAELFALLYAMGGQVWITGTDQDIFINAAPETQFFTIEKGKIKQQ